MRSVIVIGAGIVGASLAYHLAREGVDVQLLDAERPGAGTSMATLAWVNALSRRPEHYFRLSQRAMSEHRALERELGGSWIEGNGCLEWGAAPAQRAALAERVELLQSWGYAASRLSTSEAIARVEPSLRLDPTEVPWVAWFSDDRFVHVNRIIAALLAAARQRGATVRSRAEVVGWVRSGARVTGVELADGSTEHAERVVVCAGHRTRAVVASLGHDLPVRPEPGLLLVTEPAPVTVRGVIRAPGLEIRHDGGGRLLISALFAEPGLAGARRPAIDDPICQTALDRAAGVIDGLAGVSLEVVRLGHRPMPEDGRPLVGPIPGAPGAYALVTHSGVSLGPLLGRLVAEELVAGAAVGVLDPYRPGR